MYVCVCVCVCVRIWSVLSYLRQWLWTLINGLFRNVLFSGVSVNRIVSDHRIYTSASSFFFFFFFFFLLFCYWFCSRQVWPLVGVGVAHKLLRNENNQNENCLMVRRPNDNQIHRRLVPSSPQRGELSNTILGTLSRGDESLEVRSNL